jgi:parvulin-like peptidyl-prolyl isomerase
MQTTLFTIGPPRPVAIVHLTAAALVLASVSLYGCGRTTDAQRSTASPSSANSAADKRTPEQRFEVQMLSATATGQPEPVTTMVDARPVALVNNEPVTWGELRESVTETAGAQAFREVIIERGLGKLLEERAITIDDSAVADERTLFITSLHEDPNVALRLLDELRARQGLGTTRFRKLLWQNAALRALVRDRIEVTPEAVERMFQLVNGPKRQARLIMTPNLSVMEDVLERLEAGESFSDLAVEVSTDSSAARGGLLEPMSRVDETYPAAVREALWKIDPDSTLPGPRNVSMPVLLDTGYALLFLVREVSADDVQLDTVRAEMERLVRINQERVLMDQLARSILSGANVTIIDAALNESWVRSRGARQQ